MAQHKESVSSLQISFMIMMFEIGSTPLFLLGGKAKQDSWLAMSAGAVAGGILLLLFLWIQHRCPKMDLIGMLKLHFGRITGTVVGSVYCLYFAYESMRNVRDLGELTKMTLLPLTPMYITMLIAVLIMGYAIWKGAEVVFRLPEVILPLVLSFYILLILLLALMGSLDFSRLLPMFENGIRSVIQAGIPDTVSFPFGQMLAFLMLWSLWSKPGTPVKNTLVGYILISIFLVFMNAVNLAVLGPAFAATSQLPFLQTVRTLSNLKFIERLDILVTVLLFLGLLIKMMLFYYCAVRGTSALTRLPTKLMVFPVGLLIYATSFVEKDYTEHIAVGLGPSLKMDLVFQVGIPLILCGAILIHGRKSKSASPS
ncbi:GerAB/ArcD/ProY family transporter [Paenibacillus sp. sgz500958]|uniref:GerAB/ArcD/ProY family transporter n=1 Tax=Paenibacillus sp. sgz500958 TaxID=3242475 RepID=UPI0036D2E6FD